MAELAMTPPTEARTAERNAASMTGGSCGERDGGRGSLDQGAVRMAMRGVVRRWVMRTVMRGSWVIVVILLHGEMVVLGLAILRRTVLSMNAKRDELGTSDVASKVLGIVLSIAEFSVLRKVERDSDGVVSDLVGVGDLDVVGSERRVETEVGAEVGQRKLDGGGNVSDGDADDWVHPLHLVDMMLRGEEANQAEQQADGQEPSDSPTNGAARLGFSIGIATRATEAAPEASTTASLTIGLATELELDIGFVERI